MVRTWKGGEEHLSWRRKGDILQGGKEGAPGEAGKEANVCKEIESGQSKVALGPETEGYGFIPGAVGDPARQALTANLEAKGK